MYIVYYGMKDRERGIGGGGGEREDKEHERVKKCMYEREREDLNHYLPSCQIFVHVCQFIVSVVNGTISLIMLFPQKKYLMVVLATTSCSG